MSEFLLVIFILLLLHYFWFLSRIYKGVQKLQHCSNSIPAGKISVIVPFRNESEHILENLQSLQCQDYPEDKFEIIYVNDFSTDNSPAILKKNNSASNIIILDLPGDHTAEGKKSAVSHGIQNASGDIIVTTDADCTYNKSWLSSLLKYYDEKTAMIAGPVEYTDCNTFFQKMQALEFAGLIIAGAGLIGSGTPVICNAANLSYRKKVFNELNGFKNNLHLSSGDDGFLLQEISNKTDYKIKFCTDKDSIVKTKPSETLYQFFQQRKRWAGKSLNYNDKKLIIKLAAVFLFYSGVAVQFILSFISGIFLITFSVSVFLKAMFEFLILNKGKKLLFDDISLKFFIPAEILHIPYILITSTAGILAGFSWKNRKLKK